MSYSSNLEASIRGCGYGEDHPNVIKTREFARVVVTVLTAARMNASAPNRAIRKCAATLKNECTDNDIRRICDRIISEPYPYGYVSRLSRLLEDTDETVGKALAANKRLQAVMGKPGDAAAR